MRGKTTSLCVLALTIGSVAQATPVALQSATATFSQTFNRNFFINESIDGIVNSSANGWAIFDGSGTSAQTAAFETTTDLTADALHIRMIHDYAPFPRHLIGRFRISTTTDDRSTFADGLVTGGDVSANWTVLTPTSVTAGAMTATILGDGSVLMSNPVDLMDYDIMFNTPVSGITGLRLEVMDDSSLPFNGPGMHSTNGNFVLTEFEVNAVPEPATLSVLLAGALLARSRRRKAVQS